MLINRISGNIKRAALFPFVILLLLTFSPTRSDAQQTCSYGLVCSSLSTTSAGAVTGTAFALPSNYSVMVTWTVVADGSALSAALQGSQDNSTWFTIDTQTTATGGIKNYGFSSLKFVRINAVSRTGGTSTTGTITASRGFITSSSANLAATVFTGNVLFAPDNTYDIGASGATRPRHVYIGGNAVVAGNLNPSGSLIFGGQSIIANAGNGIISLYNNSGSDFSRLQFGGTTSAFPALQRSGVGIQVTGADGVLGSAFIAAPTITGTNTYSADAAITPASGTGLTLNTSNGLLRRIVYKITVASTAFVCNAVTCDITIATLPAKTTLIGVIADKTIAFACTAVCTSATLSMTLGSSAGGTDILLSFDANSAAAQYGDADAELGTLLSKVAGNTMNGSVVSWTTTAPVSLRLTSAVGNIGNGTVSNLSQGSITFYIVTERLP